MLKVLKLVALILSLLFTVTKGGISDKCLKCICEVESGCEPLGCHMDQGSLSCGYFQIKKPYYVDCYRPGSGWQSCSEDYACATKCVKAYMNRYGLSSRCDIPINCEAYARLHNGGPNGCKASMKKATDAYWEKVKAKNCNRWS